MNRTLNRLTVLTVIALAVTPMLALADGDSAVHDHASQVATEQAPSADATIRVAAPTDDEVIAAQLPTYPLEVCPVSGKALGTMGDPANHVHDGRLVRFCCGGCKGMFNEEPAAYFTKIDAAVLEKQLPGYPMTTCPVSGLELGSMGDPYEHVSGTRLVRFCCGGCTDRFEADSATYLAKIDAAAAE